MIDGLEAVEPILRLTCFGLVFLLLAVCEAVAPRRQLQSPRTYRWPNNLLLLAINTALLRVIFPTAAVGVAITAEAAHWGAFNQYDAPIVFSLLVAVLALDFVTYWQHRLFHAAPVLWRVHRTHHADLDCDLTTGLRFHPIEILLSMLIKMSAIVLIGAPALAVLIYEVILNTTSMFNHANLALAPRLDRALRTCLVTPDMHRVHHSIDGAETNRNFGFNVPWWDWLFGTYQDQPKQTHIDMDIGIPEFRDPADQRLDRILSIPFRQS